ncbi:autotransporter outer membrane beta-barrel domain-containing protein [Chelatococcus sp. GCM10030263]|uniref:autotransporter family protein n=1 Tax=Chelatococcus sp. GCM10030263 TaxID=3273387 RepID=UPI00361743EF
MRNSQQQGCGKPWALPDIGRLLRAAGLVLMMAGIATPASALPQASGSKDAGLTRSTSGFGGLSDSVQDDSSCGHGNNGNGNGGDNKDCGDGGGGGNGGGTSNCGNTNNGNGNGGNNKDCGDGGGGGNGGGTSNCGNTNNGNGNGGNNKDCGNGGSGNGGGTSNCGNTNNGNGGNSRNCGGTTIDCGNTNNGNGRGGNKRGCDHEVRDLQPDERFEGAGVIGDTTNAGVIAPGGDTIDTLTVDGAYTGKGGTLEIDGVLGGDHSPTDQLIVTGDTDGSTDVKVTNRGGLGAPTSQGIKVIDVQGASNGIFNLLGDYKFQNDPAVVAGAYGYTLQKDDGDWYMRSSFLDSEGHLRPIYQPGVPLYEAYPQVLQSLNNLPTMQQRIGNRYWGDETAKSAIPGAHTHSAFWGRIEGNRIGLSPARSTAGAHSDTDQLTLQTGLDGLFSETGEGRLIGGLNIHYGKVLADIGSIYGRGKIDAKGYGFGGTVTWLGWDGLYVDSQAQVTWADGNLDSSTLGRTMASNNRAFSYGLGVEVGKRIRLGEAWGLVPQAQLIYSAVNFNSFTDPFGARVSLDDGDAVTSRMGLATEYQSSWKNETGQVSRATFYGIANLYYALDGKTAVEVSGARFASAADKLWGGIGAGGTYSWSDAVSVFAEATANTSLANFRDSYSYKGTAGLRLTW